MDGKAKARITSLDRRLREYYQHIPNLALQRYTQQLLTTLDENTPTYEREQIIREVSQAIAKAIEHASEAAGQAIEAESFNLFAMNYYLYAGIGAFALSRYYNRQELRLLYRAVITFPGTRLPKSTPKGSITGAISQLAADRVQSEYYFQRALKRLGQTDLTAARIMNDFRESVSRGDSVRNMTRQIQKATNAELYKARRIAQTECIRSLNQGAYAAACQAIDEHGFIMTKTWLSVSDERTRDIHAESNGQTVDFYDPFIVGGEGMQYPLDPSASPENTINCRCTATYRVVGFQKNIDDR